MRRIGYWIRSLLDTEYLPPQEFVATVDPRLQNEIADYLDAGQFFAAYRGVSVCRFCWGSLGNRELSDGYWVWPERLSHYVCEHSVRLPGEFIRQVQSDAPLVPVDVHRQHLEIDDEFWKLWCRENASGACRSQLEDARRKADQECERMMLEIVAERERDEGLASQLCQWTGCQRQALRNRILCARHLIDPEQDPHLTGIYFDLRSALAPR